VIKNSSFPEHFKIFSQFFINKKKLILTTGFAPCVKLELRMNLILLFYAPASTISEIKCLPIFLVFFHACLSNDI
jgi:hypothetical protein